MIPEFRPSVRVVRGWDAAAKESKQRMRKELDRVQLFENVGRPWKGANQRFKQVDFNTAMERVEERKNIELRFEANPNLEDQYTNQSQLLNIRRSHFFGVFDLEYDKKIAAAFRSLLKRIDAKNYKRYEDALSWTLNSLFARLAWERLYADLIEAPFCELEFQILQAGHLPALPQGKEWRKCKLLYC